MVFVCAGQAEECVRVCAAASEARRRPRIDRRNHRHVVLGHLALLARSAAATW